MGLVTKYSFMSSDIGSERSEEYISLSRINVSLISQHDKKTKLKLKTINQKLYCRVNCIKKN